VIKDKNRDKEAMQRLAEYEDLDVTPEQLRQIDALYSELAKKLADERKKHEWIPVNGEKGRLPEPGVYLVSCDDKESPVQRMRMKGICFYNHYGIYDGNVYAWMPLPDPYAAPFAEC
jgi:hypothetical protein